ncbi:hypothetical protein [Aeromicrobium sp.]|uniref:hypothetical protein n=1 Tax=Aeromicrobium sp. TaxID=1871063 RepID=UPI0019AC6FCA|nr:hypothetical protein [Aeromicrobium sp.]MBC7630692.1 YtxH domain-containing protein [Aeromicrobium sp.]
MKKIPLLIVGVAGYVLGARAGRERYEQIRGQADKVWNNPTVQSAVDDVQTQAKQAGADVGSKVAEAASDAKTKVTEKVRGDPDPASDTYRPVDTDLLEDSVVHLPPMPGGPSVVADPAAPST